MFVALNDLDPFYNNYHPEFSSSSSSSSSDSSGESSGEAGDQENVYDKLLPGQVSDKAAENVYEALDPEPMYVNLGPEGLKDFDLYTDGTSSTRDEPINPREVPVLGGGLGTGIEPTRDFKSL